MLESKLTEVAGHRVRYWEGGSGFPLLMLHGVGPGTSIMGNFGAVLGPLAEHCHVVACDLIGFGESGRKREAPYFDVELWVRQGLAMLDLLGDGPLGVAGHSLGGVLALKVASRDPRVGKVLTSSTIGTAYELNEALDGFWTLPSERSQLRPVMERMFYDSDAVSEEMIDGRWELLAQEGYSEYFAAMFKSPRQPYIDEAVLSDGELGSITADVVMLHGRNDQPCPAEDTTLALAPALLGADIHLFGRCGHNLPWERTDDYLAAATALFQ